MQASTDAKTAAALQAAAAEASRFAPTLLLLTHLPALLSGGPFLAASAAASSASILQLADTLSHIIKKYGSTAARQAALPWGSSSSNRQQGHDTAEQQQGQHARDLLAQQHADAAGSPPQQQQQQTGEQPGFVFVVGVVDSLADLPAELAQCFTHHVEAQPLQREEYGQLLHALLEPLQQQQQQGVEADGPSSSRDSGSQGLSAADIAAAASQMVGLLPSDVAGVVADAAAAAVAAAAVGAAAVATGHCSDGGAGGHHNAVDEKQQLLLQQQQQQQLPRVRGAHLVEALQRVKARTATEIGAPQVPNVTWGDVGGLEDVKAAILDTIELPLKHRYVNGSTSDCIRGVYHVSCAFMAYQAMLFRRMGMWQA